MNRQKPPKGIEWTRIRQADGTELPGYTWNPTGGCFHGCTWRMPDGSITECYAKTIAERFTSGYPRRDSSITTGGLTRWTRRAS